MRINIITVGKIKEKYFTDAINEYSKRLSKYCDLKIFEVQDEKTPDKASAAIEEQIKDTEGERILKVLNKDSYIITLEIEGKSIDSVSLAKEISDIATYKNSTITFIIGGSLGLSNNIKALSNYKLSFSKMTFPHQLMRVILLEQIYRAFRINSNEPYHK